MAKIRARGFDESYVFITAAFTDRFQQGDHRPRCYRSPKNVGQDTFRQQVYLHGLAAGTKPEKLF